MMEDARWTSSTPSAIIDGVKRFPLTGIQIVVIGGGVGGLMAALECWRKGNDVVVLERANGPTSIGDAFTITPPGFSTFHHYPSMKVEYEKRIYDMTLWLYHPEGYPLSRTEPEWRRPAVPNAAPNMKTGFIKARSSFAKMQLDQAGRLGIPIEWDCKAISLTEEEEPGKVVVYTESGHRYVGDVVIAADGVGSKSREFISLGEDEILESGYAIARVGFSAADLKPGSPATTLVPTPEMRPQFRIYLAKDLHLILFLTMDFLAWAYTHKDFGTAAESWNNLVEPSTVIQSLQDQCNWDPAVLDFLKQTPQKVVDWKLTWRNPNPIWTSKSGRVVLLGDSAHAFLPTAGNGATQALEDAISLAECLRLGGKENVHWSTKVHNKLRFERVSVIQRTGFVTRDALHHADLEKIRKDPKPFNFVQGRWQWTHHPDNYATENYQAALLHLQEGTPFQNTNLPPGHVYEPWSLEDEMEREARGIKSALKQNGDWSA